MAYVDNEQNVKSCHQKVKKYWLNPRSSFDVENNSDYELDFPVTSKVSGLRVFQILLVFLYPIVTQTRSFSKSMVHSLDHNTKYRC